MTFHLRRFFLQQTVLMANRTELHVLICVQVVDSANILSALTSMTSLDWWKLVLAGVANILNLQKMLRDTEQARRSALTFYADLYLCCLSFAKRFDDY